MGKRDDEEPVVWLGNAFDQVQEPEEMAEDLEPFGAMPDDLLAVLRADRAVGDEEKSVQQWADMGPIKLDRVHQVLDQMRAIAEEIDDPMADYEDYERGRAKYQREIDDATSLRTFGEQIAPAGLPTMRHAFYTLTLHPRHMGNVVGLTMVRAMLNEAWDGVGGWRR